MERLKLDSFKVLLLVNKISSLVICRINKLFMFDLSLGHLFCMTQKIFQDVILNICLKKKMP